MLYTHCDFLDLYKEPNHDIFACAEKNLCKQQEQILIFMNDFLRLWRRRRSPKTDTSETNIIFHAREKSGLLYSGMLNSVWLLEKRITIQSQSIRIWPRVNNLFHGKAIKTSYYAQICTIYSNSEVSDNSKKNLVLFLKFSDNSVNALPFPLHFYLSVKLCLLFGSLCNDFKSHIYLRRDACYISILNRFGMSEGIIFQ